MISIEAKFVYTYNRLLIHIYIYIVILYKTLKRPQFVIT